MSSEKKRADFIKFAEGSSGKSEKPVEPIADTVGKYRMYLNTTLIIMVFVLITELASSYFIVTRPSGKIYATTLSGNVVEVTSNSISKK
jgi:hypothetical protein